MSTSEGSATVVDLQPWEVVDFPHFVGVRHSRGAWATILLKPTGQEIDVAALGCAVELHANGIEFLPARDT